MRNLGTIRTDRCAFTLIEVVISSALMAMIIVSAYLCFSAGIATRKTMEPRIEVIQNARVALAFISADLRNACPLDKEIQLLGMHRMLGDIVADNLDFASHNYTPRQQQEGDFCQLSYYLDRDAETGSVSLWRRRNPAIAPDSLSGGSKEEIAQNVRGLQFEYFDGFDWYDSWGDTSGRGKAETSQRSQPNLSGMPNAVRITIWFDSDPPKPGSDSESAEQRAPAMAFQTVACLSIAASTASPGAASSAAAADASTPGAASPPGGVN